VSCSHKLLALVAVVFLASAQTNAGGFDLAIDLGYGFGAAGNNWDFMDPEEGLASYERSYSSTGEAFYTEYKDEYVSMGSGLKVGIDATAFVTDNLGIMVNAGLSLLGGFSVEQNVRYPDGNTSEYTIKGTSNYVPLALGLKVQGKQGVFMPYAYLAGGIVIPFAVVVEGEDVDSDEPTETNELEISLVPGLNVSGGIGAKLMFSDNVGLKLECAPNFAFARIKEVRATLQSWNSSTNSYEYDYFTVKYEKNEEDLPDGSETIAHTHGGPKVSFSSIAVKLGVVFSF
jgi:hypothetical protein